MLRINIAVDDVNPSPQYRVLGTPVEKWMSSLNGEFGVKFTHFCPSNYHKQWPISQHKSWVNEMADCPFFELSAHGNYHMTENPLNYGECEWFELRDVQKIKDRIEMMQNEWEECGFDLSEMGHRNPGWLCSQESKNELEQRFKYVAVHYEHNNNLQWKCRTFFGHDGIQQENISIHNNDMIMFQSHVAGKHNHNVWNQQNYEQLRLSLTHLFENYQIEPKFLKECL